MLKQFALILALLLPGTLGALEVQIADFKQARAHVLEHGYRYMLKHARLLFESTATTQSTELNKILNDSLLNSTRSLQLYQGQHAGDWYVQLQLDNRQRVQSWWQAQLEQMQRVVPGLGVERHGLRLHQADNTITIMGRLVRALPVLQEPGSDAADMTVALNAKQQARIYLSDSGVRMTTRLPYEPQQALYIDHKFISSLPQEMFAWSVIVINDETRSHLMKHIDYLEPLLKRLNSTVSLSSLKQTLAKYNGELFVGFSNSREGFDINIAVSNSDHMDLAMAGITKSQNVVINLGKKELTFMRGEQRWVMSTNVRIAEILSGRRTIHFPQHLPEQLAKDQKLVAAAYANTLALAQKYYEQLPALKQHEERVGNQELGLLRESLKEMIPHFKEMVLSAAHEGRELNVQANGIGNALVILSGLCLCQQFDHLQETDESAISQVYQQVSAYVKTHRQWPRRGGDISASPAAYCYLKPEDEQHFVVPVLIENPASHAGRGSYVAFSNGEIRFYEGRAIWNRAVELRADGGASHWDDWTLQHQEFERVGGLTDPDEDVQIIFEQLQN